MKVLLCFEEEGKCNRESAREVMNFNCRLKKIENVVGSLLASVFILELSYARADCGCTSTLVDGAALVARHTILHRQRISYPRERETSRYLSLLKSEIKMVRPGQAFIFHLLK